MVLISCADSVWFTVVGAWVKTAMTTQCTEEVLSLSVPNKAPMEGVISIRSMAMQADGKVLIGGEFTAMGMLTRSRLARVTNTDAALQELSLSSGNSTATWTRGQACPEVWRVILEKSSDGDGWTSMGAGTRIIAGWELAGLDLPLDASLYIRARGHGAGGFHNASGSLLESVKIFYPAPFTSSSVSHVLLLLLE